MYRPAFALPILALLIACPGEAALTPDDEPSLAGRDASITPWPDPLPIYADDVPPAHKGLVVGTWSPSDPEGFDQEWLDEGGLRVVFTMETASRRGWRGFSTGDATIPADALLKDRAGAMVGYIYSLVSRKPEAGVFADQPAVLHVRHRGRVRVRLDGRVVVDEPAPPNGEWRDVRAQVTLTDPYDVVLAKVGRGNADLGESMDLQIRVSAPDGSAILGQTWNSMRPPGIPTDL